jgi:hypothetical protein
MGWAYNQPVRLYVNGTLRASSASLTTQFVTATYLFRIGKARDATPNHPSAVIDEVRFSSSIRYSSSFTPHRLLASGTYASPTFDAVRRQADWLALLINQIAPPQTSISWEVRAADQADAFGNPQAVWAPYSGNPDDLPDGRYFQWRATLSTSADRLTSPTLISVEAQTSEAGYNLYHAIGPGPASLDYTEPWAEVGPGVGETETDALDTGAVHWFGIRPVDASGVESPLTQAEVRLELDESGERVPDRPAGALTLSARPLPLGAVRLQWRYRIGELGVVPQVFQIFGDGGTGTIDYNTPLGEVLCRQDQSWYAWTSGQLTSGVEHQLAVRAITTGGVWDEQPACAQVTPDNAAPTEVDALEAETVL